MTAGPPAGLAAGDGATVDQRSDRDFYPEADPDRRLSRRENQVLDVVAEGASNGEIAQRLSISPGTVKKHLENIFGKLDVASRTAALARTGRTVGPTRRDVHGST